MPRHLILLSFTALTLSGCGMVGNAGEGMWNGTKAVWNGATGWLRDAPEPDDSQYAYNNFESRGRAQSQAAPTPKSAPEPAAPRTPYAGPQAAASYDPIERLPGAYDYPESGYVPSDPEKPIVTARTASPSAGGPVYFREESVVPERQGYSWSPGAAGSAGANASAAPAPGGSRPAYSYSPETRGASPAASAPVQTAQMSAPASRPSYSYSPGAGPSSASSPAPVQTQAAPTAAASRPSYSYSPSAAATSTQASPPAMTGRAVETPVTPSTSRPQYAQTPVQSAPVQSAPVQSYSAPAQQAYDPLYDPAPAAPSLVQSYAGYDSGSVSVYSAPGSGTRTIGQRPGGQAMPGYATPSYGGYQQSAPSYQQPGYYQQSAPQYRAPAQPQYQPQPQSQRPAPSQTAMPNIAYVNLQGPTRTEDFQMCQSRTGGAVMMTASGPRLSQAFDSCMRQMGYLPEAEAQARMQRR